MNSNWFNIETLNGSNVSLVPLELKHKSALLNAATEGNLSNLWYTTIPNEQSIDTYLNEALEGYKNQTMIPFVVVDKISNTIVGTTRFLNVDVKNKRLEIGYTWYAKKYQKTYVNTETKYLLLSHAFDQLNAIAVELRTHWFNHGSRNSILRLGAKQDGVIRNHRILDNGTVRDTVVFSIIENEWPSVKYNLEFKLNKNY